jgi:enoyl-CoA hydratase
MRADKANAVNLDMFAELSEAASWLDQQPTVRAVVLHGEGRHFCAGIDLASLQQLLQQRGAGDELRSRIRQLQDAFSSVENLRVPVIAAVHGACVGAGVDLIAACDLRYSSSDAQFCIKEVDLGIVPDLGSLQRLRHVLGQARLAELAYTAASFDGARAEQLGLVSRNFATPAELRAGVAAIAAAIAGKPAGAVRGIKQNLLYSREHTVAEGLDHVASWNAEMLQSAAPAD